MIAYARCLDNYLMEVAVSCSPCSVNMVPGVPDVKWVWCPQNSSAEEKAIKAFTEKACFEVAKHIRAFDVLIKAPPHEFTYTKGYKEPDDQHITAEFETSAGRKTYHVYTEGAYPQWQLQCRKDGTPLAIAADDQAGRAEMGVRTSQKYWRRKSGDLTARKGSSSSIFSSGSMGSIGARGSSSSIASTNRSSSVSTNDSPSSSSSDGESNKQGGSQAYTPPHHRDQCSPPAGRPKFGPCKAGMKYNPTSSESKNVSAMKSWRK